MWFTLESDPSVFTSLCSKLSNDPIAAREVYDLSMIPNFQDALGFIFLHKYTPRTVPAVESSGLVFVKQTCDNNCATIAALNVLLNSPDHILSTDMSNIKQHLLALNPAERGRFVESNLQLREIHNSFVCQEVEIVRASIHEKSQYTDSEAFHYSAFLPFAGCEGACELDGLVASPIIYSASGPWLDKVQDAIQARIQQIAKSGQEIRFSLVAIVPGHPEDIVEAEMDNRPRSVNYIPDVLDMYKRLAVSGTFDRFFQK